MSTYDLDNLTQMKFDTYVEKFPKSEPYSNLYHIVVESKLLMIVLYFDELILTRDAKLMSSCKEDLSKEFKMQGI